MKRFWSWLQTFFTEHPAKALGLLAWLSALLIQSGDLASSDAHRRLQMASSFWTDEPEVLPGDYPEFGLKGPDGRVHAWNGMGQALVFIPFDVTARGIVNAAGLKGKIAKKVYFALVAGLYQPLLAACGIMAAFYLLLELQFSARHAAWGCLGLLYGSTFFVYSAIGQENNLIFFTTTFGLVHLARWVRSGNRLNLLIYAVSLGFGVLIRLTQVLDLAATALLLLVVLLKSDTSSFSKRLKHGVLIVLPVWSLTVFLDRWFQWHRFGSWTNTYSGIYGQEMHKLYPDLPPTYPFSGSFWDGFSGQFLSPSFSVFLFDPLLLPCLILLFTQIRKADAWKRLLGFFVVGLFLLQALFYARYYAWHGASGWGSRYVTTPCQLLVLLGCAWMAANWLRWKPWTRHILGICILGSITLQLSGTALSYNLELTQHPFLNFYVTIILRLVNVIAVFTGNFYTWGLGLREWGAGACAWNYLPIRASGYLPPGLCAILWSVWAVLGVLWICLLTATLKALKSMDPHRINTFPNPNPSATPAIPSTNESVT